MYVIQCDALFEGHWAGTLSSLCFPSLTSDLLGAILSRYESKWIRGKCERLANSGVFRSVSQVYAIGHIRLPELIKIQCFKSASQLYMLD